MVLDRRIAAATLIVCVALVWIRPARPGAAARSPVAKPWVCLAASAIGPLFRDVVATSACRPPTTIDVWPPMARFRRAADPIQPPAAPANLAATVVGQTVILGWSAAAGGPSSYVLQAGSATSLADLADADTGSLATTLTVTNVPPRAYFVRVLARNSSGTSPPSNEIVVIVGGGCASAPDRPTSLSASVTGVAVTLAWQPPLTGCPPSSYIVQAGSAPGLSDLANFSTGSTATTFAANNVAPGSYFVRVLAAGAAGLSTPSNEVPLVVGGCAGPPGATTSLAARVSGANVQLAWLPPTGSPTGYVISAGSAPGRADLGAIPTGSTSTTFFASNVGAGTYYVRVAATNACGAGPASNDVIVRVDPTSTFRQAGTVFRSTLAGDFAIVRVLPDNYIPLTVMQAADSRLHGFAVAQSFAPVSAPILFSLQPSGLDFGITHVFGNGDAFTPVLFQAADGNLYGTTDFRGEFGHGTIYRMTLAGVFTSLYSFVGGPDGSIPMGMMQGGDGNFYGVTEDGGQFLHGTVFRRSGDGSVAALHSFLDTTEGFLPTPLVQAGDGNLYGALGGGGPLRNGTIFRITPAGGFSIVHAFTGSADGGFPSTGMILGADGSLYGTTDTGGALGRGTLFRMTLSGDLTVLHAFSGNAADAWLPTGLVQAGDGNLYGTSFAGGLFDNGTLFRVTPAGAFTVLHMFSGGIDDGAGVRGLIQARDGNLYGTTDR
jgi:uncharacterized repeat protein (TIGR03803 family)